MLVLSEDQRMLMESARGAVAANAPIAAFRKLRAESSGDGFSRAFWRQCAEMGWTGVLVPEAFGGIDFGVVGAGLIAREMARTLAPIAVPVDRRVRGERTASRRFGGAEVNWLPRIAQRRSDRRLRARRRRAPRSPPQSKPCTPVRAGGSTGVKHMALDGHVADAFLDRRRNRERRSDCFLSAPRPRAWRAMRAPWSTAGASRPSASTAFRSIRTQRSLAALDDRVDARRRPRGRRRGALRRRRGGVRADDRLSQGAASSSTAGSAASRPCSIARRACTSRSRIPGRRR